MPSIFPTDYNILYMQRDWRERVSSVAQEEEDFDGPFPTFEKLLAGAEHFFVRPLLHSLLVYHQNRAPRALTDSQLYIDFIECYVADFLLMKHNGAGRKVFLEQARAMGNSGLNIPRDWNTMASPNSPLMLALNAYRCLMEELEIVKGLEPTITAITVTIGPPVNNDIDDLFLHFSVETKTFELNDQEGDVPNHLLYSYTKLYNLRKGRKRPRPSVERREVAPTDGGGMWSSLWERLSSRTQSSSQKP